MQNGVGDACQLGNVPGDTAGVAHALAVGLALLAKALLVDRGRIGQAADRFAMQHRTQALACVAA
jgi:hypothetical protein